MIRCNHLTKRYRGRTVIDRLDLVVDGGMCALLGANGAGKSTLLKLLTGLVRPDAGTVELAGESVMPGASAWKQKVGAMPEEAGLFESLTLTENLMAVGPVYGLTREETRRRTQDLFRLLDLNAGSATVARECSYGMRKKTSLALALLHNPPVLLLDEPFEGIDPASARNMERALRCMADRGATVLFTSHILPVVEAVADRVLILQQGRLAWDDAPGTSLAETYFALTAEAPKPEIAWLG